MYERIKRSPGIESIFDVYSNILFIHYSCGDMFKLHELRQIQAFKGIVPRSTVGAIGLFDRNDQKCQVFSMHVTGKELGELAEKTDIDETEYEMLNSFYAHIVDCSERTLFVHWNMKDETYGFEAIALRYSQLGGKPVLIPQDMRLNLPEFITAITDGHLSMVLMYLLKANNLLTPHILPGAEEAQAVERGDFLAAHLSTRDKVTALASIFELLLSENLMANSYIL